MVKGKLSPHSGSVALRQLNPIHKKDTIKFLSYITSLCKGPCDLNAILVQVSPILKKNEIGVF